MERACEGDIPGSAEFGRKVVVELEHVAQILGPGEAQASEDIGYLLAPRTEPRIAIASGEHPRPVLTS